MFEVWLEHRRDRNSSQATARDRFRINDSYEVASSGNVRKGSAIRQQGRRHDRAGTPPRSFTIQPWRRAHPSTITCPGDGRHVPPTTPPTLSEQDSQAGVSNPPGQLETPHHDSPLTPSATRHAASARPPRQRAFAHHRLADFRVRIDRAPASRAPTPSAWAIPATTAPGPSSTPSRPNPP